MALLVLVVDRDNDVGVKAGIETPIIGREEVLKAAEALLLADPEDSDGNTMFAAVKIYDELIEKGINAEVVVVAGDPHLGIVADTKIRKQLEEIFSRGEFDGIVFVSDGAEDDQVLPIVSSFAPIVSKKTVIVRQAQQLERTFYTIKTALEDPSFARLLLGVPGLLLVLWFFLQDEAIRLIAGILGFYMLIKGFGLEEAFINTLKAFFTFNPKSPSLPFQVASIATLLVGISFALHTYSSLPADQLLESARILAFSTFISIVLFLFGKAVEAVYMKQAYRIGDYVLFGATLSVAYLVMDALINIMEGRGDVFLALVTGISSLVIYYLLAVLALWIKRSPILTRSVVGATVFDRTGTKLGRVRKVEGEYAVIEKGKRKLRVPISRLKLSGDKLVVS